MNTTYVCDIGGYPLVKLVNNNPSDFSMFQGVKGHYDKVPTKPMSGYQKQKWMREFVLHKRKAANRIANKRARLARKMTRKRCV